MGSLVLLQMLAELECTLTIFELALKSLQRELYLLAILLTYVALHVGSHVSPILDRLRAARKGAVNVTLEWFL